MHHSRYLKTGNVGDATPKRGGSKRCSLDSCEYAKSAKGYCVPHYSQHKSSKPFTFTDAHRNATVCTIENCENPPNPNGICPMHKERKYKTGSYGTEPPRNKGVIDRDCSIDGCTKIAIAKELCATHLGRKKRTGNVGAVETAKQRSMCSVDGCPNVSVGQKLCSMHVTRLIRNGDVGSVEPIDQTKECCSHGDCERNQIGDSPYCEMHRNRLRRTGKLGPVGLYDTTSKDCAYEDCPEASVIHGYCTKHHYKMERQGKLPHSKVCVVEDCPNFTTGKREYCPRHLSRVYKTGEPGPVELLKAAPGSGSLTGYGYRRIHRDGIVHLEHRYVMEQHIGRSLDNNEHVHHKDGDRTNNDLDNLEIWIVEEQGKHHMGQRVEDAICSLFKKYPEFFEDVLYNLPKPQPPAIEIVLPQVKEYARAPCGVLNCWLEAHAKGYCRSHYVKWKRQIGPVKPSPASNQPQFCQVEDCTRYVYANSRCGMHYDRHRKGRPVGSNKSVYALPGSGHVSDNYKYITVDGNPMFEHRYIMQQLIGRKLHKYETVHHKNGDGLDNRPENLELWTGKHGSGSRAEDLIEWVVRDYPDEVRAILEASKLTA